MTKNINQNQVIKTCAACISRFAAALANVKVGDKLYGEPEPDNEFDSNAIKLMNGDKEQIGFISTDRTTIEGCITNIALLELNLDKLEFIVTDIHDRSFAKGGNGKILELRVVIPKEEPTLEFSIKGSKTQYPAKFEALEKIKQGQDVLLQVKKEGKKAIAYLSGQPAGYVDEEKLEEVLLSLDMLEGEPLTAKVVGTYRTNINVRAKVDMKKVEAKKASKRMGDVLVSVVDGGILTQEGLDERIEALETYGVTERQKLALFESMVKYEADVEMRIPLRPKTLYQDSQGLVKKSVAYVNMGRNLLFEGERGTGKNVLTETLAWLYARPLYEFSLNSGHDNNSLLGGKTIETDDEGITKMGFDRESIVEAAEVGGFIVFDEFNTALSHTMSLFNSLLDDRRRIQVPGYKLVEAHSNFAAIATQNRNYTGTFDNNQATVDRFVPIIFPELKGITDILMNKVPTADANTLDTMNSVFTTLQKLVRDGEVNEHAMTIRGFIDAALAVEMDIELRDSLHDNIVNRMTDEDERIIVKAMIDDIVA